MDSSDGRKKSRRFQSNFHQADKGDFRWKCRCLNDRKLQVNQKCAKKRFSNIWQYKHFLEKRGGDTAACIKLPGA